MKPPSIYRYITLLSLLTLSGLLISCSKPQDTVVSLSGSTMGTIYNVTIVKPSDRFEASSVEVLGDQINSRLREINQLMSTYIVDSELSRLNKSEAFKPFTVSHETRYVLDAALRLNELSNGMLDITVGPMVNLWGFGPDQRPTTRPDEGELIELQEFVGVDKFTLTNNEVTKYHQNVYIDLSTIAKGYAVDQLAELLLGEGIENFLVEIGGEMRVSGTKPNQQAWRVAVEKPTNAERVIQRILKVKDSAIATSGDYRNYFEEDGMRYSHLINPKSGEPIQHNLVSVTVVSQTAIEADGLATALIVMGKQEGMQLAESENIAAFFITKEGDEFKEYQSSAFTSSVDFY